MDINIWIEWLAMESWQEDFPHYWIVSHKTRKYVYFPEVGSMELIR